MGLSVLHLKKLTVSHYQQGVGNPGPKFHPRIFFLGSLLEPVVTDWASKKAHSEIKLAYNKFLRSVLRSNT